MQPPRPRTGISALRWAIYGVLLLVTAAMIGVPNFVKARGVKCKNACISNVRQIDGAKEQWALENKALSGTPVDPAALAPYLKGGWPTCPGGGSYIPGTIATAPRCSLGHTL